MPRGLQSVTYVEPVAPEGDSPQEWFDHDANGASRVLDVPWNDRALAVAELLGYSNIDTSGGEGAYKLHRYLPDYHPSFPLQIAKRVRIQPRGSRQFQTENGRKIAKYEQARLFIEYEFPDYDVLEDHEVHGTDEKEFLRYRTFEAQPAAEYLSPPTGTVLKWSEGVQKGQPFPGNVGFIVGTIDYHWKWLQVPFDGLPESTIQRCVGCVNKTTFANCKPHTLLLLATPLKRVASPFQFRTWDIEYVARYNRRGHNKHYNFVTKKYEQASATEKGDFFEPGSVPDGKLLFNEFDFHKLFDVNDSEPPEAP